MAVPRYSDRVVPAHGEADAPVMLVNEAPGPDEDRAGIPCVGRQGGVIYREARESGWPWALGAPAFSWPILDDAKGDPDYAARLDAKARFLALRARHVCVTNAFDRWPRPEGGDKAFCEPAAEEVLSGANLARMRGEATPARRVLLVCGRLAWLACTGEAIERPAARENDRLSAGELATINERLAARFTHAWYMGHTRRWSAHLGETRAVLREVAAAAGWTAAGGARNASGR